MRLCDLLHPTECVQPNGIQLGNLSLEDPVLDVTLDSRTVRPGSLFFAVRGTSADGSRFVSQALAQGAVAAVVDRPGDWVPRTIQVPDVRQSVGIFASRFFGEPSKSFKVVAVTGTNGKTTTTHLLDQAWTQMGKRSGLVGTVVYRVPGADAVPMPAALTTPDAITLQRLWWSMKQNSAERVAVEASSIALDQYRLNGTQVHTAIFTNLTQDHLDYHPDMESYFRAKQRLFTEFAPEVSIVCVDDVWGRRLSDSIRGNRLRYSVTGEPADIRLLSHRLEAGIPGEGDRVVAEVDYLGESLCFRTRLLGRHNLANLLAAAAALHGMGASSSEALAVLETAMGAPGRLQRVGPPGRCEVLVDYAHSEDALEQVLKSLHPIRVARGGRVITVFGCGGDRDKTKRPKMGKVVSSASDVTITTSDNPRTENPEGILDDIEAGIVRQQTKYIREVDRREAIQTALRMASDKDIVLIAGKGHEDYQIIGVEKRPFDDREVVREYFSSCSATSPSGTCSSASTPT